MSKKSKEYLESINIDNKKFVTTKLEGQGETRSAYMLSDLLDSYLKKYSKIL